MVAAVGGGCDVVPRQDEPAQVLVLGAPVAGSADEVPAPAQAGEPEADESAAEARALARGLEAASKVAQQQGKGTRPKLKLSGSRRTSCDEITCLIDPSSPACGRGCVDTGFHRPPAPVPAPPDVLSRTDIIRVMSPLRGRVKGCDRDGTGAGASVRVRVTVAASGRPSEVQVLAPLKDAATGKCIAQLVRGARFRASTGGPMTFTFPFVLGR
ncbi:MAG: hypothetical protein IT370_13995 [Deltaproteobacteria bacterium]|nr:hypothetical protein [Deltaproteobacteria bacterium]